MLHKLGDGPDGPVDRILSDHPPTPERENRVGNIIQTQHLLDLGHEMVHHIAGPDSWLDAQERVEGWRQALRSAGASEPSLLRGDWSARSGYEIGHRLAAMPEVTAVLCGNDPMALGLLRALTERGCHVPGDVSVVGFDDVPEAAFFLPPLTTVGQDFGELGRRALHLLLDRISGGHRLQSALPIEPREHHIIMNPRAGQEIRQISIMLATSAQLWPLGRTVALTPRRLSRIISAL